MAPRSRHRRPKYTRKSRALLAIGAAGAGIVLPLIAATGADAAPVNTSATVSRCETGGDWNPDDQSTDPGNGPDGSDGSGDCWDGPGGYSAPVKAAQGTPYRAAGPMWASGYHTGVDFPVPTGTPIKAVADGCVVSAGWAGSYGNQVVIQHDDGEYSEYAHLSRLTVQAGDKVKAGQEIGLSGATGNVSGPHLHFEVRTTPDYGSDIDPVEYMRRHGIHV
ncbi:M23 family metallopeptidase [Streptomyces sp. TRM70350]|uniref:M23 family metallopeptidase n=1 Tax=Streptomyces sp. TRM70350 TaxID=2856165 RepID=UPI001C43ED1D|nr:M23 family metallopeptidase [Streptomyces sp. TRM70350]MBV7699420.1 M23 family metallopeptidase [Streptomyces sp. TRM70350]